MKIIIRAGGVLRSGPETEMVNDYIGRAAKLTRGCGFLGVEEQAVDLRNAKNRQQETRQIIAPLKGLSTPVVVLDERGKDVTSRQIAKSLANWRDEGHAQIHILIGGADGFDPAALPQHVQKWCLGRATWPHKLVRVMIAEQIYRALSILNGSPYHRD